MAEATFFGEIHQELDAKMSPCGKWNMPLFYPGGSVAEHRHTRSEGSVFDRSCCRIFQITGKNAAAVLDSILLFPVKTLDVNCCMENILLHENGTFAAVFTLCRMQENDFMLITQAGIPEKEIAYLTGALSKKLEFRELSEAMAHLALTGKKSAELLAAAGAEELPAENRWAMITLKDDEGDQLRCIAVNRQRFGEMSFELCCNGAVALEIYGALYRINGTAPAGIQAENSLRIESGIPGIPTELNENIYPQEWGFIPDMTRNFTGRDALQKVTNFRRGAVLELERHPALPGTEVFSGEKAIGIVTSSAFCPTAGCAKAMVLLNENCGVKSGDTLTCHINDKKTTAQIL